MGDTQQIAGAAATPLNWPTFPFPASIAAGIVVILACLALLAAHRFDATGGLLTISLMVVAAFISVNFTGILYGVPQTPINEIMIGALATSLGAVIAFWMSGGRR